VPAAPLEIQDATVRRLENQLSGIDELQQLVRQQSWVLAERRQALITAAVTGQFDVTTGRGADLP
jgi:type I restriction enzyme S subunit